MKQWPAIVAGALLSGLLAISVVADFAFGVTVMPGCLATILLLGAVVALGLWGLSRSRIVLVAGVAFLASILVVRFSPLGPVKSFRSFHRQLHPGMTQEAVLDRLGRAFPEGGLFRRPSVFRSGEGEPESMSFTLDPSRGDYDSEIVLVHFDAGRLVSSRYLPD